MAMAKQFACALFVLSMYLLYERISGSVVSARVPYWEQQASKHGEQNNEQDAPQYRVHGKIGKEALELG